VQYHQLLGNNVHIMKCIIVSDSIHLDKFRPISNQGPRSSLPHLTICQSSLHCLQYHQLHMCCISTTDLTLFFTSYEFLPLSVWLDLLSWRLVFLILAPIVISRDLIWLYQFQFWKILIVSLVVSYATF